MPSPSLSDRVAELCLVNWTEFIAEWGDLATEIPTSSRKREFEGYILLGEDWCVLNAETFNNAILKLSVWLEGYDAAIAALRPHLEAMTSIVADEFDGIGGHYRSKIVDAMAALDNTEQS